MYYIYIILWNTVKKILNWQVKLIYQFNTPALIQQLASNKKRTKKHLCFEFTLLVLSLPLHTKKSRPRYLKYFCNCRNCNVSADSENGCPGEILKQESSWKQKVPSAVPLLLEVALHSGQDDLLSAALKKSRQKYPKGSISANSEYWCPGEFLKQESSSAGPLLLQVSLQQALHTGQDDLVGAAALLGAVRGLDGQHPRHAQRPAQLPLLAHGDVVCLQPGLQGVLPLLQLLRAVGLAFLGRKDASKALLHVPVPFPQDFHLLHGVAHDEWQGALLVLWECCQDNAVRERRLCKLLVLTEGWEAASKILEIRAH